MGVEAQQISTIRNVKYIYRLLRDAIILNYTQRLRQILRMGSISGRITGLAHPQASLRCLLLLQPKLLLLMLLHRTVLVLQLHEHGLLLWRQTALILLQRLQHVQLLRRQIKRWRPLLRRS